MLFTFWQRISIVLPAAAAAAAAASCLEQATDLAAGVINLSSQYSTVRLILYGAASAAVRYSEQ